MNGSIFQNKYQCSFDMRLASIVGVDEAIFLQRVHYWIERKSIHPEENERFYHDGKYWIYNTYAEWHEQFAFWPVIKIRRMVAKLEESGLLLTGNFNNMRGDKTRWYTIDYSILQNMLDTYGTRNNTDTTDQNEQSPSDQNEQSNTIYNYNNIEINKDIDTINLKNNNIDTINNTVTNNNKNIKVQVHGDVLRNATQSFEPDDFGDCDSDTFEILPPRPRMPLDVPGGYENKKTTDMGIVMAQVMRACLDQGYSTEWQTRTACEVVDYYYDKYESTFHRYHPHIKQKSMDKVISCMFDRTAEKLGLGAEEYEEMIDKHFETQYENCDYNICHFMTSGVRDNRYFETCY